MKNTPLAATAATAKRFYYLYSWLSDFARESQFQPFDPSLLGCHHLQGTDNSASQSARTIIFNGHLLALIEVGGIAKEEPNRAKATKQHKSNQYL
jgi:hypothetical protein